MPLSSRAEKALSVTLLFLSMTVAVSAQGIAETKQQAANEKAKPFSNPFHNERIKRTELKDYPIEAFHDLAIVDGMWVPESKDPAKALVFPEQVRIICTKSERTCEELKIILEPTSGVVFIGDIEETSWQITSWDAHGLLASYGPDISARAASDRCNRHVLTMTFASGAVSTSDIPTHDKGCEPFPETNSYRLVRGGYYIDTTPGNNADKPIRPNK